MNVFKEKGNPYQRKSTENKPNSGERVTLTVSPATERSAITRQKAKDENEDKRIQNLDNHSSSGPLSYLYTDNPFFL